MSDVKKPLADVSGEELINDILETHDYVLADFYMPQCGPCRLLEPKLEVLAAEYTQVHFVKVIAQEEPKLCNDFGIRRAPTLLFFRRGELVDRIDVQIPFSRLENMVRALTEEA